jgi:hypothetical protein
MGKSLYEDNVYHTYSRLLVIPNLRVMHYPTTFENREKDKNGGGGGGNKIPGGLEKKRMVYKH